MILVVESVVLCLGFTLMVYIMSREPIKSLYNYPPKIQEQVRTLPEYKDQIPTQKNKLAAKLGACVLFVLILALLLRYVNGCTTFLRAFGTGFLLWTVVNLWDALVLDILWFCHDPHFVFKGTEDIITYPFSLGQIEHRKELQQLVIRIVEACGAPHTFSLSEWESIENTATINARKTNTKQFIKEMQKISPNIMIVGEYKGSESYIHVKCRICGYEWDSKPSNLKVGHGCRKCSKVYTPTPKEFSRIIAESRPDITLIGPFVNVTTKILVRCNNCGREWKIVPYSLLAGKMCSVCAGNYSPTTEEFALKMKAINPSIEVLGEYKNNNTHIECKCLNCNYIWTPTPHDLVGGSGCPKCSRKKQCRST